MKDLKEEAREILEMYRVATIDVVHRSCNTTTESMEKTAKNCALIAVQRLIKEVSIILLTSVSKNTPEFTRVEKRYIELEEIREEIKRSGI